MTKPILFIALDDLYEREEETLGIAEQLTAVEGNFGFKVNLDYLLENGLTGPRSSLKLIQQLGRKVFADLKMWNGTRTMKAVIEMLVDSGVDYLNVYALADGLLPGAIKAAECSKTKILAVTVLTHYDEKYCRKWFQLSLQKTVRLMAETARDNGCHGVILPGTVLPIVQDLELEKVTPGIRLPWYPEDARHQQEVEPTIAVAGGATGLVCGGPIMKSREKVGIDNREALKRVLADMTGQPSLI